MHAYWHGGWWFWSFWWLIFPIMGFLFGGFGMWMSYRAQRDRMELMKTYIAQGKTPEEIGKLMEQVRGLGPGPNSWDDQSWDSDQWASGRWGYGRRGYGRWGYWGPFREWRRFVVFACLALGFFLASQYADFPGTEQAFTLVAIIMGVLAVGSFAMALLATLMSRNDVKKNGG